METGGETMESKLNSLSNKIYTTPRTELYEQDNIVLPWKAKKVYSVEKVDTFLTQLGLNAEELEQQLEKLKEENLQLEKELKIVKETGVVGAEGEELFQKQREIDEILREVEQMREAERVMLKQTQVYCDEMKAKAEKEGNEYREQTLGEGQAYVQELNLTVAGLEQRIQELNEVVHEKELYVQATVAQTVEKIGKELEMTVAQIHASLCGDAKEKESISL